ncbi:CBS domain-containing protein [Methanosarcinaceae archaeon]|nr:CBS domain-containing protein [Methanosarcinaceae archaeon]
MQVPTPEDLKRRRIELGLTQSELARRAGVSQPLIARIELGDVDPRLSTVSRICSAFDAAEKEQQLPVCDIISSTVISVRPGQSVEEAVSIMNRYGFSQLPVIENGLPVGSISEDLIVRSIAGNKHVAHMVVSDLMAESFPTVPRTTPVPVVSRILERSPAVLVLEKGIVIGVITKSDIMKIIRE